MKFEFEVRHIEIRPEGSPEWIRKRSFNFKISLDRLIEEADNERKKIAAHYGINVLSIATRIVDENGAEIWCRFCPDYS